MDISSHHVDNSPTTYCKAFAESSPRQITMTAKSFLRRVTLANVSSKTLGVSTLIVALASLYQSWRPLSMLALSQSISLEDPVCEVSTYKVRLLSYDPLIMHLQDFITPRERTHILKLAYVPCIKNS